MHLCPFIFSDSIFISWFLASLEFRKSNEKCNFCNLKKVNRIWLPYKTNKDMLKLVKKICYAEKKIAISSKICAAKIIKFAWVKNICHSSNRILTSIANIVNVFVDTNSAKLLGNYWWWLEVNFRHWIFLLEFF